MLIDVTDLVGNTFSVNARKVFRLRSTFGDSQPSDATVIDLEARRVFSRDPLEDIVKLVLNYSVLCKFTAIPGIPCWIPAERILQIRPPTTSQHHPNAKSVISVETVGTAMIEQQVLEDVQQATDITNNAP